MFLNVCDDKVQVFSGEQTGKRKEEISLVICHSCYLEILSCKKEDLTLSNREHRSFMTIWLISLSSSLVCDAAGLLFVCESVPPGERGTLPHPSSTCLIPSSIFFLISSHISSSLSLSLHLPLELAFFSNFRRHYKPPFSPLIYLSLHSPSSLTRSTCTLHLLLSCSCDLFPCHWELVGQA